MAVTAVSICANACIRLGARPIASFNDGDDKATMCAAVYPTVKDNILSLYDWKFTLAKRQLARQTATPASEWTYQFTLPSDRLHDQAVEVYNTDQEGANPITAFEINGNLLMTDEEEIWIDYQTSTTESAWPPYFVELMIKACMVEFAIPLTDQNNTRDTLLKEVYGPSADGNGGMILTAKNRNASNAPGQAITSFPLIDARLGDGL